MTPAGMCLLQVLGLLLLQHTVIQQASQLSKSVMRNMHLSAGDTSLACALTTVVM